MVHGQGTRESLKLAGKHPGPGSSLRFKMTEALLKDCSESECVHGLIQCSVRHVLSLALSLILSFVPLLITTCFLFQDVFSKQKIFLSDYVRYSLSSLVHL